MDLKDIEDEIYNFNEHYFQEIADIVDDNLDFIDSNNLMVPKENYTILVNFLHSTLRSLRVIDSEFCSQTTLNLDQDVILLQNIHKTVKEKTKSIKEVFLTKFLVQSKVFQELNQELNTLKNTIHTSPDNKTRSKQLAQDLTDLRHIYFDIFVSILREDKNYFFKALLEIINSKTYLFDKLMWKEAKKSGIIVKHFGGLKIQGDMNSKKYILYVTNMMRPYTQEYEYLQSCLKVYK